MWLKQIQLFQLSDFSTSPEKLQEKLGLLAFKPCMPSWSSSMGWVAPVEDNDSLVRVLNGRIMLCLKIEEKILPASVIREEVKEKAKKIEIAEQRKIRSKEKLALKEEITLTLLPRAFSKFTKIYAYIDPQNQWLVLGTTHAGKTEQFLSLFKKTVSDKIEALTAKKLSTTLTHWVQHHQYPTFLAIEKSGLLQDPNQQNRIIRCQEQDLSAASIQLLIKEGCEVKQIALCWNDRVKFLLKDNLFLQNIKFQEEITDQVQEMEPESATQQFDADFIIMTETLALMLKELSEVFKVMPVEISESRKFISKEINNDFSDANVSDAPF